MPLTQTKFTGVQHMSRMDDINNVVEELQVDMDKFYEKGNKAAGTRARKHLMTLKNLAHEIRQEIQAKKNEM
tara:strand:+ start:22329 stop:22544 length:216 start_codon:yes stop_codon:yes gene_type:complete